MRRFESENQEMGGQKIREPGSVDGLYQRTRKWEGEGSRNQKVRRFVSENQEGGGLGSDNEEMGGGRIRELGSEEV